MGLGGLGVDKIYVVVAKGDTVRMFPTSLKFARVLTGGFKVSMEISLMYG